MKYNEENASSNSLDVNIGKVINTQRKVLEVLLYRNHTAHET